jgi:hypoxanthine-guanine phosphoribosyltransferase
MVKQPFKRKLTGHSTAVAATAANATFASSCGMHMGMGMDTNQRFRSLGNVAVLKPEAI